MLCNNSDEIFDVVGYEGFDALFIADTWLTGGISNQKIVDDVTHAGYSFHHATRTYRNGGRVGILIGIL